jgi:hypothetical protein
MRRIAIVCAFGFSVAAMAAGGAGSATSKSSFAVLVAPTTTAASNGLTLQTAMTGSFNVAAKTASGDGTYSLTAGSTVLETGTFTLDQRLVAFQFYGCGEVTMEGERIPLPPDFCGGRVIFGVHATSSTGVRHDGLLEVNCQIHDPGGQAPPGTSEGVKVNARGINFNKHITGDNLLQVLP